MNLHIFNDQHGFTLNLTVNRFAESDKLGNNRFINLNRKTIYKHEKVTYLEKNIRSFRKFIGKTKHITSVIFYPFDYTASFFLRELHKVYPAVRVGWVFWGYEYYHRPDIYLSNFDAFSLKQYKKRDSLISQARNRFVFLFKKMFLIPVFNGKLLDKSYNYINDFYSFLPWDFKNVSIRGGMKNCFYHQVSFLSIEQIIQGVEKNNERTGKIMIGHAASLSVNHAEVMEKIAQMSLKSVVFFPLEYGNNEYRKEIKKMALLLFGSRAEFLEKRLDLQSYHQKLSEVDFAIFNFRWQEALGNILFLLWNGSKVFLKEKSNVYLQFKEWGLNIFSIEDDLNELNLKNKLSQEQGLHNKIILEKLFSEREVKKYWEHLM